MPSCTDTDKVHLARAIELAARGAGAVKPNPVVGAVVARDGEVLGEGWHEQLRRRARRGQRDRGVRPGGPERRDAVRVARAVLPRGQDAALHRRDPAGGHQARGGRLRRPHREGLRAWAGDPARRGRRGGGRRRRAGRQRAPAQPGLPQARARRAPVGAVQVRDDARRQGRHAHAATRSGSAARTAASWRTAGARRSTRSWSASAPRWPTTRS